MRKIRLLFLSANPLRSALTLDEECAAIERELRMTPGRDDFDFRSKWAVGVDEMMRHLNEWQPTIIHFSGHGRSAETRGLLLSSHETRDVDVASQATAFTTAEGSGIFLQEDHRSQHVSECALKKMIASAAPSTRLVVLNSCYSNSTAAALCHVVDCVVGINGAIEDSSARSFAVGFYRALGNRRSIGNAVAQAIATLAAKHLPAQYLPVCQTRGGIDADEIFLIGSTRLSATSRRAASRWTRRSRVRRSARTVSRTSGR